MVPLTVFLISFDKVVFHCKFILIYIVKNLKFKFCQFRKKNFYINNKKKINEGETEEDNKSPYTSGCHIIASKLTNRKYRYFIILFTLIYI